MLSELKVGWRRLLSGAQAELRGDTSGALVSTDAHGRFQEAVLQGNVYTVSNPAVGVTIVATTDISPLPANTGVPILGLYNPLTSSKSLVILRAILATISGTPGGPIVWNYAVNQNITATQNAIPQNNLLSGGQGSVAKGYSLTAITGSTAGILLGVLAQATAVASAGSSAYTGEETGGLIIVPPGCFLGLAAAAVGTTHAVAASITYEEIPAVQY